MIRKIGQSVRERYLIRRYIEPFVKGNQDRAITPENKICLFCQPRGGSAWLSEIIASLPNSGIMDEPLWSGPFDRSDTMPLSGNRKVKEVDELGFYFNQPIPELEKWPEAKQMFHKLLSGQLNSLHLYEEMNLSRLSNYETYITKFNKANLLFHWLRSNFEFKSIVLLRHPCATISSQILGGHFAHAQPIPSTITPSFRYSEYFELYEVIWPDIKTHEEYLAFIWAINIKEVVDHLSRNNDYLIVCYESLLTRYDFEIERIFNHLNRPIPSGIDTIRHKPSPTAKSTSVPNILKGQQLDAWRNGQSKSVFNNILRVTQSLGIDFYSNELEPDYSDVYSRPR